MESESNMNKLQKNLRNGIFALLVLGAIYGFYYIATGINYTAHNTLRRSFIDHPEFIPSAQVVKIWSMGMQTLVADFYWLSAIQYIGSNAIKADYKKYLGVMLNLVTDLSPHFTYPYQIGMLLIPDINQRYEIMTDEQEKIHIQEAIDLGVKGVRNNCNMEKIEKISQEFDLNKLYNNQDLKEPCTEAMIPYYLGYVSYWNNNDPVAASKWFRVAGTHAAAPRGAQLMSAIMQGKTGGREKAIVMFLSIAESMDSDPNSTCRKVTAELRDILAPAFENQAKLTPAFLKQIEAIRVEAKAELWDKQEEIDRTDISSYCSSYLDKSVREMNLKYIQDADAEYFKKTGSHARNAKVLLDEGYISYLPEDYQKQSEEFFNQLKG